MARAERLISRPVLQEIKYFFKAKLILLNVDEIVEIIYI